MGTAEPRQGRCCDPHGRTRSDRRCHRRRQRVAGQLPDRRLWRAGPVQQPAPRLAPRDGPRVADASDHQVGGHLLRDRPHRGVRRAGGAPRDVWRSGPGVPRDPDGCLAQPDRRRSHHTANVPRLPRCIIGAGSLDRGRRQTPPPGQTPHGDGWHRPQVVRRRPRTSPFRRGDPIAGVHERDGPGTTPDGSSAVLQSEPEKRPSPRRMSWCWLAPRSTSG